MIEQFLSEFWSFIETTEKLFCTPILSGFNNEYFEIYHDELKMPSGENYVNKYIEIFNKNKEKYPLMNNLYDFNLNL